MRFAIFFSVFLAFAAPALAGPPYQTDDPEPVDVGHFEIYAFADGVRTRDGSAGQSGFDINYGAAEDLQFTAVLPLGFDDLRGARASMGFSDIEFGAKYRFLHQDDVGWDVSVFPQVDLPTSSHAALGERHASFFLPLWVQKDWGKWSTFGGGGCTLNNGGGSKDSCSAGWALTHQVLPDLQVGAEIYRQTAGSRRGRASTGLGAGAIYNLSDNYRLMASWGPGIQNPAQTARFSWYAAVLVTY